MSTGNCAEITAALDSVTYRITPTNDVSTHGGGAIPLGTERSYTVEPIGGSGTSKGASQAFFRYAMTNSSDDFGNPLADDGISLSENENSLGRLWIGRIRWEFPSAAAATGADAYDASGGENGSSSGSSADAIRWFPYLSNFAVSGGTRHLAQSYSTRAYPVNGSVVDFGGGIGWDGFGFEGVDVPAPAVSFDITARTPEGFVANFAAFLNRILPYVGTVNGTKFYGCAPGTVLFNGITSGGLRQGTNSAGGKFSYWEMNFNFSAAPNGYVNINGAPVPVGGWDYLWNLTDEDGAIVATYIEQIFRQTNFKQLGLGG